MSEILLASTKKHYLYKVSLNASKKFQSWARSPDYTNPVLGGQSSFEPGELEKNKNDNNKHWSPTKLSLPSLPRLVEVKQSSPKVHAPIIVEFVTIGLWLERKEEEPACQIYPEKLLWHTTCSALSSLIWGVNRRSECRSRPTVFWDSVCMWRPQGLS